MLSNCPDGAGAVSIEVDPKNLSVPAKARVMEACKGVIWLIRDPYGIRIAMYTVCILIGEEPSFLSCIKEVGN